MEFTGPVELLSKKEKIIFLQNKAEEKVVFLIKAKNNAGVAKFNIITKSIDKETIKKIELGIRPFTHLESVVKMGELKPEQSFDINVPTGFIPYGQRIRFSFSSNPLIQYLRCMEYLISRRWKAESPDCLWTRLERWEYAPCAIFQ